ncbi:hypothetical protein MPTK1_6g01850 [Marchantia polymorpha subsp. ruderalis]|uniref:Uncharacterized protein n=2 Tax=Marchantia polymorpha TaxID=3197 RepID=A0AAF6BMJ5_MARPO|nr:hypothetical protein MARPO_0052s0019 [Marchantia polymorpha]BBN13229.1 hypothetical protein Mp_6g01850 [Marchantia polymorpha subsp. ruderalis]|eukprot:PTQ38216.1 hypothetical protein MARPO_0052s0019 [Marchantia polymorpha]
MSPLRLLLRNIFLKSFTKQELIPSWSAFKSAIKFWGQHWNSTKIPHDPLIVSSFSNLYLDFDRLHDYNILDFDLNEKKMLA